MKTIRIIENCNKWDLPDMNVEREDQNTPECRENGKESSRMYRITMVIQLKQHQQLSPQQQLGR